MVVETGSLSQSNHTFSYICITKADCMKTFGVVFFASKQQKDKQDTAK